MLGLALSVVVSATIAGPLGATRFLFDERLSVMNPGKIVDIIFKLMWKEDGLPGLPQPELFQWLEEDYPAIPRPEIAEALVRMVEDQSVVADTTADGLRWFYLHKMFRPGVAIAKIMFAVDVSCQAYIENPASDSDAFYETPDGYYVRALGSGVKVKWHNEIEKKWHVTVINDMAMAISLYTYASGL